MDELWVSTSGGRYRVVDAIGSSHDTVEPLTIDIEAGTKRYIEKWHEYAPLANTRECFQAGLEAALGIREDIHNQETMVEDE